MYCNGDKRQKLCKEFYAFRMFVYHFLRKEASLHYKKFDAKKK